VWSDLDTDGDLDLFLANLVDLDLPATDAAHRIVDRFLRPVDQDES
jgi:hypothetical protein